MEEIEKRHRKERKDLQAKIQSLKKIIKGDKNKKKEITQEIANLESELDLRHEKELVEARNSEIQDNDSPLENGNYHNEDSEDLSSKQKLSKAQKRREKKELAEKERSARIKQQEKDNVHGTRNLEEKSINAKLLAKNLQLVTIDSDGDCLYKAVSHQLEVTKRPILSVKELRERTAAHIKENKDDYIPFMSHPETNEMLTDDEFEEYCDSIATTNMWGGQIEIQAMSTLLKCPIQVIQAAGPETINQGDEYEGPALILTYHRHLYKLGEHYNSTLAIPDSNESSPDNNEIENL